MRILVLDNYDSFTWNLVQPLAAAGAECLVHRSDKIDCGGIAELNVDRILISPGPFGPAQTGVCADAVREFGTRVPVLGVCLGMQVVASVAGASVVQSGAPVHGKQREVRHTGLGVLAGLPDPLRVGLYHSLVVATDEIPPRLEVTARATDGTVMACRMVDRPVEGVLFHPESFLTPDGVSLLHNFMNQGHVAGGRPIEPGRAHVE